VVGAACVVDLTMCSEAQKASAWKGQSSLSGTIKVLSYLNKTGLMCQTAIPQAWPVIPEPSWWCGLVLPPAC
jgi:hypothetical protein